jgi:hypothetical protein
MSRRRFVGIYASVLTMAFWVSGLAAYGGLILPVLHERFGVPATAPVTRRVTWALNLAGVVAVATWALTLALAGRAWPRRARRAMWSLLIGSALMLAAQFALLERLGRRMDTRQTDSAGFYPLHRAYLLVSTTQWLANLALVGLMLGAPSRDEAPTTPDPGR